MHRPRRLVRLLAASALVLVAAACRGTARLTPSDHETVLASHSLGAPDPGARGPHSTRTLYYGSGNDRNRPEYRDSVSIRTDTVNASRLIALGDQADSRRRYWGFGPEAFPLNGRVWYPEGDGPFPLVLIVQGNHDPRDFSDPGYAYLGELLASRGIIGVSLDMNFVNGTQPRENDVRGWLFLRHLDAWRRFHDDPANPFHGKVDWEKIALIGHSRGGEAVGHAAAFNRLSHYPDDASIRFDFGYDIRGLVAIAPVDGQYRPSNRFVPVEDVSYLVFHGSHDGDVTSFHGLRQFDRVALTPGSSHVKSAVYMYRANHGQWNEVWGAHDNGPRSPRILDLQHLVPPEQQRRFAEVYVSAFLELTLRGDERYIPLFRDHRQAGGWLPPTMYITRFRTAGYRPLANFSEDIDLTTGTAAGVRIRGDSLATWREGELLLRSRNNVDGSASQGVQALWLGWNNRMAGADTTVMGPPAAYEIALPEGLPARWGVGGGSRLELSLTGDRAMPPPRRPPASDVDSATGRSGPAGGEAQRREGREELPPLDLTVEVADADGVTARVPLSRYGAIRRPLEIGVLRRRDLERQRFQNRWETVLQDYSIPMADLVSEAPGLDPSRLSRIRLVFDRAPAGTVVIGDLGIDVGR
jgi:hypothetical protein